ncbi:uncharacterized protein LOC106169974 [Lingula anatina]|uniref:Uncharacterized protein LOC106169974 n=1 Tax=Lingula anatina TaxID=7574 RepID=A0A1S3J4C1_LINAN|nr:uncharacterized protein LOC106169974 [Lingula anatina]XP_013405112.1 uncharacterized protein LOC106169974 [Lingula anatina]|eukprot:XP_013405111.1 uncharacterized protein LOC106169974 [Lingula anatina]
MASAVAETRFVTHRVPKKMSIRDFVRANKLEFKTGRGFYQLTKPETIQAYKEVVARRKSDRSFISGPAVKGVLGIDKEVRKFTLDRSKLPDFDIFVQSTSYNRALVANTEFLYEVDGSSGPVKRSLAGAALYTGEGASSATPAAKRSRTAPAPSRPTGVPGGPIEIVFSFDTTGSMSSCIMQVRQSVQDMIQRLMSDIPNLKISVFAHGDYCDEGAYGYVTKYIDFTNDVGKLCHFVNDVEGTGGGDFEECYELVLHQVREELSWSPGSQRSLVMIGDATPHQPNYHLNKKRLDWKVETDRLFNELGVNIYAVQCLNNSESDKFYSTLAEKTHGRHLKLDEFSNVFDFIMAICYREHGAEFLEAYEQEVAMRRGGSGMNAELHRMFEELKGGDSSDPAVTSTTPDTAASAKTTIKKATPKKAITKGAAKKGAPKRSAVDDTDAPAKVDMPEKKSTAKTTPEAPVREYREHVTVNNFLLKNMKWSQWKLAMVKSKPKENVDAWVPRRQKHVGYRNVDLFRDDTQRPAVYEVAVQPKERAKKYVMYVRHTGGFTSHVHWDTYILRHQNVISQLDGVLNQGCKVFVRRAFVPKSVRVGRKSLKGVGEIRSALMDRYNYAWNKRLQGKRHHRQVIKCGVTISSEDY